MKTFEWKPIVVVGGVDVHERISGDITVNAVVAAARIANFTLVREGVEDPYAYVGQPVRIAYLDVEKDVEVDLFNGFVRTPAIDLNNGTITLECTDNFNERIQSGEPGLLSIVQSEGVYSKYVFGEYDTLSPQDKFEALLSTTTKQIALDGMGQYTILPLNAPLATPSFTFTEDDIIVNSSSVSLGSAIEESQGSVVSEAPTPAADLSSVATPPRAIGPVNEVICEVYFRFPRLYERHYVFGLDYPEFTAPNGPVFGGSGIPQRETFRSAVAGTGVHIVNESYTPPPKTNFYPYSPDPNSGGVQWLATEQDRRTLCTHASIRGVVRFSRTVTRKYVKIVRCPESIARYGLNSRRETAAVEVKYNFNAWENDMSLAPFIAPISGAIGEYTRDITTNVGLPKAGDPNAPEVTEDDTDESEALKALEVLTKQSEREIIQDNVGVGSSSYGGSSAAQTTSLNFQVHIKRAPLVAGQKAVYETSKWQATGTISEVAYTLSASGSATAVVTLTSAFIPPGEYSGIVPPQIGGWYGSPTPPPPPDPEAPPPPAVPAPPGNTPSPVPPPVPEPAPAPPDDGGGQPYYRQVQSFFYGTTRYEDVFPWVDAYFLKTDSLYVPIGYEDEDFPMGSCRIKAPKVDLDDIEEIQSQYVEVKDVELIQDLMGTPIP